ncbi:UNKNOWN [Stylonychia lemnae]|uniref:Uncharacterized protein n=1 Tax=Stylonychia lemnae TaxID=5949 RepID=A0A078AB97_STYLE|nr:UNKNOWN [Stylonychia lemnae]|eukprot:CDW78058.1 UNKNOWN [Stylonychia lemnae]
MNSKSRYLPLHTSPTQENNSEQRKQREITQTIAVKGYNKQVYQFDHWQTLSEYRNTISLCIETLAKK